MVPRAPSDETQGGPERRYPRRCRCSRGSTRGREGRCARAGQCDCVQGGQAATGVGDVSEVDSHRADAVEGTENQWLLLFALLRIHRIRDVLGLVAVQARTATEDVEKPPPGLIDIVATRQEAQVHVEKVDHHLEICLQSFEGMG